jgi:transcriptional regulator GlxA family with amidase domain
VPDQQSHPDVLAARGQQRMEQHLRRTFRVAELARYIAVSERRVNTWTEPIAKDNAATAARSPS